MLKHLRTYRSTALTLAGLACFVAASPAKAELHSQSKELVVMEPHDFPEQAQELGNSRFLHADTAGNTYLYVEQQGGARLSVFKVTDPAAIQLVSSTPLTTTGPFDSFVHWMAMRNWFVFVMGKERPSWTCTGEASKPPHGSGACGSRPDHAARGNRLFRSQRAIQLRSSRTP